MGQVVAYGARSSLSYVAGMVLGNTVWLLVATLGLAAMALQYEEVFVTVKWLGVAFILFIAWNLWTKDVENPTLQFNRSAGRGLLGGTILTLSNPKAVVFFGAVLPHAFDLTSLTIAEVVYISLLGITIDLTVQLGYVLTASKIARAVRSTKAMKRLNRTGATVMTACAGWMAVSQ